MKTTIRLDDELYAEVKQLTARTGRTLSATIEDSLRAMLARRRAMERSTLHLTTVGGNGLLPGVELDDSAALMDVMDR